MRLIQLLFTAALWNAMSAAAPAQSAPEVNLPPSPSGQTAIQVGGTWTKTEDGGQRYENGKWIVVDYGRPILRGRRDIFGSGDQYGKTVSGDAPVWRAGANANTRLTTQVPLTIGGRTVQPGIYSLLVDLKPGNWTLIVSSQPVQEQFDPNDKVKLSGGNNYTPKFDVVRAPMTTQPSDTSLEQFTIAFSNVTDAGATLAMWWERTIATINIGIGSAAAK